MLRAESYRWLRRLGTMGILVAYMMGISQMLPAIAADFTPDAATGTGCPTVTSCAMTAAYGPCCCLTSTAPPDIDTPGLMAVGCALPDDYSSGTVGLMSHTITRMADLAGPLTATIRVARSTPTASSILLLPADEVPRLSV